MSSKAYIIPNPSSSPLLSDNSFEGREVRDRAHVDEVNFERYQPPEFVVKALQHTRVECTWDQGELDREKKLTNVSMWRQLQESDLQQYVASSDSSESEDDGGESDGIVEDSFGRVDRKKDKHSK